jgi:hypothetical protein
MLQDQSGGLGLSIKYFLSPQTEHDRMRLIPAAGAASPPIDPLGKRLQLTVRSAQKPDFHSHGIDQMKGFCFIIALSLAMTSSWLGLRPLLKYSSHCLCQI